MKKLNKKGFTIVELVIVIAVIAILAAVMIPTFSGVVTKAQESAAVQEVKAAYTETLADDLSDATDSDDVVSILTSTITVKATNGKYVDITADGKVSINSNQTAAASAYTHKVDGNLIKLK